VVEKPLVNHQQSEGRVLLQELLVAPKGLSFASAQASSRSGIRT
jgi:hypothetical protein